MPIVRMLITEMQQVPRPATPDDDRLELALRLDPRPIGELTVERTQQHPLALHIAHLHLRQGIRPGGEDHRAASRCISARS